MKYFAYGSNMASARLRARVENAEIVGVYYLACHDLRFHKLGQDGSAKCDAYRTGNLDDLVEGVVFEIDAREIPILDQIEGLGNGYEKETVALLNEEALALEAFTYTATQIDNSLHPFSWYKHHVLVGARSAGLSPEYIARVERVVDSPDPDTSRTVRELKIHELSSCE